MKILLCNKFYYRRGGDCIYTINLEHLLKQHGHNVAIFAMDYYENLDTIWSEYFPSEIKFKLGLGIIEVFKRPFGSSEVKEKFNKILDFFCPDIVHLNNIHSQISPIIAEIAYKRGIKVIWTLHDYKLLCPRYDCLQNGKDICELCFKDKHNVLRHKCMKNSQLASYLSYWESIKWNRKKIEIFTDVYVCPSAFMVDKMKQGGFNPIKLINLCNFIDINRCKRNNYKKEDYYCYIGRLSHEKGIATLIKAANGLPYKLIIVGNGPLTDELKTKANRNIQFIGFKEWNDIKELVGKARFSVIPSEWYENNPLSVIEAECLGTPILGSNIGGIPELINQDINGMIFESGNIIDLRNKIEQMWNTSFNYQQIAKTAMEKYDAEKYYHQIMEIYNSQKI